MKNFKIWASMGMLALASFGAAQQAGDLAVAGFDPANIDSTCKPCEDFNQYANGGWLAKNPIPAAYPSWGSFNILNESNRDNLKVILEEAAKNTAAPKGSVDQKIGDYYAACMDEPAIEAAGLKPLAPEFQRIEKISTPAALRRAGMIEAMIEADGQGSGFMCAGQQAREDGPVPWPGAELFLAGRIPRDDEKERAYGDGCAMGQPEIIRGPVQGRECGRGRGPQGESEDRRDEPHGAGLEPGGAEKLSPQV